MTSDRGLDLRAAVRGLVLDEHDHALLVRFVFGDVHVWALPGGGLAPGESPEAGLRREFLEELGLAEFEIGPHIWNREHIIPMTSGHDGQRDRIHLVRVERFEPEPSIGWEAMRAEHVHELRWWSLDEIDAASSTSVRFAPQRLAALIRALLVGGVPRTPIETGI
jgi:ADP-ribose pyrophosphatase YjhB (NUDIX family)